MTGERQTDESEITSTFAMCIAETVGQSVNKLVHTGRRASTAPEFSLGHSGFKFPES